MGFEHYINKDGKKLRYGYTTGTCAALAAQGATEYLLTGQLPKTVSLVTPKGIEVEVTLEEASLTDGKAICAVRKDAGDDIDVTHQALIYAEVSQILGSGIVVDGGRGVGRVTRPGLDQPVGAAAINHVPRQMIAHEVETICEKHNYDGGLSVTIHIPKGEELAEKTFNPQLGIEGGISILGTSGIVEPKSLAALIATIETEMNMLAEEGKKEILAVPGNYGEDFLKSYPTLEEFPVVKYSNFVGEFLDFTVSMGFTSVLMVGHIGKMVKLAGGIMNTHSRYADCRTELFAAHAALAGAKQETIQQLMNAATTDRCIEILQEDNLWEQTLSTILEKIQMYLTRRVGDRVKIGAVVFSNIHGLLGKTVEAEELLERWTK